MTREGEVSLELIGSVAVVTLNRPEKLNAMTSTMDRQMNHLAYEINNDERIGVVVLTGRGSRAFSAGSDINGLVDYESDWQMRNRFDARLDYARAVWLIRKPIIAAINGYCIGGGLEMACAADIRLASPTASFAAGEIRWGWHGGSGQTQFLTRIVGSGHAMEMLLTGDQMDAAEALRIGLVQHVVDEPLLMQKAMTLADHIADRPPIAVERVKSMVRMAANVPLEAGLLIENDSFAALMATEDAAEGRRAFAARRDPEFRGR